MSQLTYWQQCYLDITNQGKLPRSKIGKEKLNLLKPIGDTVTVIFPASSNNPARAENYIVSKTNCDVPNHLIDVVTLAANLLLWKERNYDLYSDGKRLYQEVPSEKQLPDWSLAGILFKHGEDAYELWNELHFSEEELFQLQKIFRNHQNEGCSIQGSKADIAEALSARNEPKLLL